MRRNLLCILCALLFWANQSVAQYCSDTLFTGNATMHEFIGTTGACSLGLYDTSTYVVAVDNSQYDGSRTCGACVQISNGAGSLIARVVDECFGCGANSLDLSYNAYRVLDSTMLGLVPMQWKFVGCPASGPIAFTYQGSNAYYIKVQVRNHRYPIEKVEVRGNEATYTQLARTSDNFFSSTWPSGPENGPYDFRITNVLGDTILETGIPLLTNNDSVFSGAHQFPVCINEINGIKTPFKTKSQVEILNSSVNTLSIFNHNNYSIDYQVLDVLGRNVATGNLTGNGQQTVPLQQGGVYIVRYTVPQFGTQAKRVMVR